MITKPSAQDPFSIFPTGEGTGAPVDHLGTLAFQDLRQIDSVLSRAPAGENTHEFSIFITIEPLFDIFQTVETSGQRAAHLVFFATHQSDFRHPNLLLDPQIIPRVPPIEERPLLPHPMITFLQPMQTEQRARQG
jgi:hypothetical protein